LGARVLVQPAIEVADPHDWQPVDLAMERLDEFNWVVFSSANGVRFFLQRLLDAGKDLRRLGQTRLAAIGPGTAEALTRYYLHADLQPREFRAEALADELAAAAPHARFLLVRASRGREVLAERLTAAGATVHQVVSYSSADVRHADVDNCRLLADGHVDWVTVTSSAIARSLAAMFGDNLHRTCLASISPVTSATLRELGYEPATEASVYTMPGVVQAIRDSVR
jgi:uroporphyrinogen III methyltransferase/synthase